MSKSVKRNYRSHIRAEQAHATRERVLTAARTLFTAQGYHTTSINEIAQAARASPETVYAAFGSKRELLAQLIAVAIAREEDDVPFTQRSWVRSMERESGPRERLRYWIAHTCDTLERTSPIHVLIRDAAAGEPTLAKLQLTQRQYWLKTQTELMKFIDMPGLTALRTERAMAAQTFWALASPEMHYLLRFEQGWTKARYRDWLTDALETLLLRRELP
jgi:AcrR family transcriptional regulator